MRCASSVAVGGVPSAAVTRAALSPCQTSGAGWIGRQSPVEAAVALAVVGDAAGGVERDGLERAHERPAQAEAVRDGLVEVFRRDIALADQAHRLGEQRALQAIENEAIDLALHQDGHLPDAGHHFGRARHGRGAGPRRAAEFDDGNEVRRIHRMRDQAARASGEIRGELRRTDRRGRAGDNRGRGRHRVELAEDLALDRQLLGQIFLHPVDVRDGGVETVGCRDSRQRARGVIDESRPLLFGQARRDEPARRVELAWCVVVEAHLPAGARENHGPGAADQTRADDRGR